MGTELCDKINTGLVENNLSQFMEIHDDDSLTFRIPLNHPPTTTVSYQNAQYVLSSHISIKDISAMNNIYKNNGNARMVTKEVIFEANKRFNEPKSFKKLLRNVSNDFISDYISFVCKENTEFCKCYNSTATDKPDTERFYTACVDGYLHIAFSKFMKIARVEMLFGTRI